MAWQRVKLEAVELRRVALPLVTPFRTSFGLQLERDALLVRVITDVGDGWGECVAMAEPLYSAEYVDGAADVMRALPRPAAASPPTTSPPRRWRASSAGVKGHPMAKAALEMAVLDAELRAAGQPFAEPSARCATRSTAACRSASPDDRRAARAGRRLPRRGLPAHQAEDRAGLRRRARRAVRERFGPTIPLQVDANTAYHSPTTRRRAERSTRSTCCSSSSRSPEDDIAATRSSRSGSRTPICLDESIVSAESAADAIALGACSIVNIKAGRVGGYLEAVRVHDVCRAAGVPVWCGGMLETGLGRAANVALAALPGFTLPGDTSASDRYYAPDITEPFVLEDGRLRVPKGPGLGVWPLADVLATATRSVEVVRHEGSRST